MIHLGEMGKGILSTEKYTSKREAVFRVGGRYSCTRTRTLTLLGFCMFRGETVIDSQCISAEDISYPVPRLWLDTLRGEVLGNQETHLKPPKLSTNYRKASPPSFVVSMRTSSAAQSAIPADLVSAPQRLPSMLSCQDAVALLQGRSAASPGAASTWPQSGL